MDRVKKLIHAEEEEVFPYTGSGVTVAILDTGIAMHPDFADRVIGFRDFVGTSRMPYDDCGHGTHVAGCLCGNGACSGGLYAGVAPGCRILSGKVLDDKGDGTISNMAAGIEWVLDSRELYQIKILNISVSMGETDHVRMMQYLVSCLEKVWDAGIFVVVAAGNKGPAAGSISPLGASRKVVTVGCHDGNSFHGRQNSCESYSGRGPTCAELKKPDIVAPGTDIMSCSAGFLQTVRGCRDAIL
ncbi:S8 family serine peptidase [Eisenbergiella tayi]|uniref:S8 family serine peptidase n=1 Tax=Eisenbergiella tayi TaxID=1432052 RepID=UPI0004B78BF3|nr:S8 family serine peptidase [Eisenbergiella tayi]